MNTMNNCVFYRLEINCVSLATDKLSTRTYALLISGRRNIWLRTETYSNE